MSSFELSEIPTIFTARLILRPIDFDKDLPDCFAYSKNPDVSRYTLWQAHQCIQDTEAFFQIARFRYLQKVPEPLAICFKDENRMIGSIGVWWTSTESFRMEMGYSLAAEHWGTGVMSEAAAAMRDFVFENLKVNRLEAHCLAPNIGSAKVLEKTGMRFEGLLREFVMWRGHLMDVKHFSLLRREWELISRTKVQ